ncbi:multicopper oxidase domain-containing protein [Thermoactinospora rubra]|uniref:multicopper oxidase domain-containing protein n=1 Tax=Thermoactinospora rubra TaxID=1088767 RepID=UPI000A121249|nr:multicopper oxidase domain-containing protein [Thermoactinospora rubra]
MTTALLLGLDRALVMLVAVLWGLAGGLLAAGRRDRALWLLLAALAATALRVAAVVALARAGWWFAGEKALLALPLLLPPAAAAAVVTLPRLLPRRIRGLRPGPPPRPVIETREPTSATSHPAKTPHPAEASRVAELVPVLACAYAAVAGVFMAFAVGYPPAPHLAAVTVLAVAGATAVTWFRVAGPPGSRPAPPGRGWRVSGAVVAALAVAWAGTAMWATRPPGALHLAAAHAEPPPRGRPAADPRRFTLTAQAATVTLPSGRPFPALTFNATAPGPLLRVRQGDHVEVTLRNRLPDRGVTLHWHGVHVPNGEDGVPGVTQDAVAPGGEHVYRFTAQQPGTTGTTRTRRPTPACSAGCSARSSWTPPRPAASTAPCCCTPSASSPRSSRAGRARRPLPAPPYACVSSTPTTSRTPSPWTACRTGSPPWTGSR